MHLGCACMGSVNDFLKIEAGYDGYVYGVVSSSSYGDGSGDGYVYGNGYGAGYDLDYYGDDILVIKHINGLQVYNIDGAPTTITHVRSNVAKGHILNRDLTLTPCYIAKSNNLFTHGETIKEAYDALRDKMFRYMDEEERIDAFLEEYKIETKYSAKMYYDWYNRLTGSCKLGRMTFVINHGIDLENDTYTVQEFIELYENDYGAKVIKALKERIIGNKKKELNHD